MTVRQGTTKARRRLTPKARRRLAIAVAFVAISLGVCMLVFAAFSNQYLQSLLIQLGSAFVLVGPIVWLEESFRGLTQQVKETKDDLKRTTKDMEAIRNKLATAEKRRTEDLNSLVERAGEGHQDAFFELLRRDRKATYPTIHPAGPRARLVGTGKDQGRDDAEKPGILLWLEKMDVEDDLRVRFSEADSPTDALLVHIEMQTGEPYRPKPTYERSPQTVGPDPVLWLAGEGVDELQESLAKAIEPPRGGWDNLATTLGLMTSVLRIAADLRAGVAPATRGDVGQVLEMLNDNWLVTSKALVNRSQKSWWIRKTIGGLAVLESPPAGDPPAGSAAAEVSFKKVYRAIEQERSRSRGGGGQDEPPTPATT
jgi:hypothetical protein